MAPRLRLRPNGICGIGDREADRAGLSAVSHPDRAVRAEQLIQERGMMTEPTHVDGNAAAGAFAEVLGFDVTTATLTCGHVVAPGLSPRVTFITAGPASWCAARAAETSWPG